MVISGEKFTKIFRESIEDWHKNQESNNPYIGDSLEFILYNKNQIDTIQWHVEDEIRRIDILDKEIASLKRKIDSLNQQRTDLVEKLDDIFLNQFQLVVQTKDSRMNSETPAWLVDRMSILELKIYHMEEQTQRTDVSEEHRNTCANKLKVLLEQRADMILCMNQLIEDLTLGKKYMKVYRQMKMYNDKSLNPSLYKKI